MSNLLVIVYHGFYNEWAVNNFVCDAIINASPLIRCEFVTAFPFGTANVSPTGETQLPTILIGRLVNDDVNSGFVLTSMEDIGFFNGDDLFVSDNFGFHDCLPDLVCFNC